MRLSFNEQFVGVRQDIKELTAAFRELIRMDGDLKRINDAMARIGSQVDDHEQRLRFVENGHAGDRVRIGNAERVAWALLLIVFNVAQYFLTH